MNKALKLRRLISDDMIIKIIDTLATLNGDDLRKCVRQMGPSIEKSLKSEDLF